MRGIYNKGEVIMNKENKKLLAEVINDRLTKSLGENQEEASAAFEEAMQAIDRQNDIDKDTKEKIIKVLEIGTVVVVAPLI